MTHDRANEFVGSYAGLDKLLKERKVSYIWALKDPCHALSSAVNKSLSNLSEEIKFVEDLSNHFSSSQRQAKLQRMQKETNFPELSMKKFIKTRWLSLGLTLERILDMWEGLSYYMKQKPKYAGVPVKKYEDFIMLFESPIFKLGILCLSGILHKKINKSNVKWQDQKLEIQNLKPKTTQCIKDLSFLFIDPSQVPQDVLTPKALKWDKQETIETYCLDYDRFITKSFQGNRPKV